MKRLLLAVVSGLMLLPASAQASVTYHFDLLSGGARYGGNFGGFTVTLPDFVRPVDRFSAGPAKIGGSEYGQRVPFTSLASCSIRDSHGPLACGDQLFLQNVTSYTASSNTYDILEFGIKLTANQGFGYEYFYFAPGVFGRLGTFDTTLLADQRGRITISGNAAAVPDIATWSMMILGLAVTGIMLRGRSRWLRDDLLSNPPSI